jgi:Tfp pilus assembly protein PilP
MTRFSTYIGACAVIVFSSQTFAANPFNTLKKPQQPAEVVEPVKAPDLEKPPLQRWPVHNYILMGILTTKASSPTTKRVAIIRTPAPHSRTYILHFGDLLGAQDGYIKAFDSSGFTVVQRGEDDTPEEVRLKVRNRGATKTND